MLFRSFYGSSEPGTPPHRDSIPSNPLRPHSGETGGRSGDQRLRFQLEFSIVPPGRSFYCPAWVCDMKVTIREFSFFVAVNLA